VCPFANDSAYVRVRFTLANLYGSPTSSYTYKAYVNNTKY